MAFNTLIRALEQILMPFDIRIPRVSGADANAIDISDTVTGVQTAGFGTRINWLSNGGSTIAAIGFEVGGTGTNNESRISFYTQLVAGNLIRQITIGSNGAIGQYKGITTAGNGVPAIYASGRLTGQTGNGTTILDYVTSAADGTYMVTFNFNVTSYSSGQFGLNLSYIDESGGSAGGPLSIIAPTGVISTTISQVGGMMGIPVTIRVKASNHITISAVKSGTLTYSAEAQITQVT